MATFDVVGTFERIKESENFKEFTERTSDSGWTSQRYRYNVLSGTNRTLMQSEALFKADMSNNIMLYTKAEYDNGKVVKEGERTDIPFKSRLSVDCSKYPTSRLYIIDLNTKKDRNAAIEIRRKFNEQLDLSSEDLDSFGVSSQKEAEDKLKKVNSNRHVYVSEYDFLAEVKTLIENEAYHEKKFRVRGNVAYSYNESNGQFYSNNRPNRIELSDEEEDVYARCTVKLFYTKSSFNDDSYEDDHTVLINGYDRYYDSGRNIKRNLYKPTTIVYHIKNDSKADHQYAGFKNRFTVADPDKVMTRTIICNMVNGSEVVNIDKSMFSEEQLEDIELGFKTEAEVIAELGGTTYGNFVNEWQFSKIRGDAEDTGFTVDDIDESLHPADDDDTDLFD